MSSKKRIRFIINPISGIGKKNQLPDLIDTYLDHDKYDYEIRLTEYRNHAKKIAKDSTEEGFDIVCAVGGDGSVHEVGTSLIGTKTVMAIIPTGSGNGLARHVQIPLEIIDAIQCINDGYTTKMDTISVNDRPLIGFGGFGFDAFIAKKFDDVSKRGFSTYVKLVLKEFLGYKAPRIELRIAEKTYHTRAFLCSIANSSEFGNGFCISPNSKIDDGMLEFCLMKRLPILGMPKLILDFFLRKADKNRHISILPFSEATMRINRPFAHFDGEPMDIPNELKISVNSKSLNILVGKKYDEVR